VPAPEDEPDEGQPIELSELELSAVSEASNQMMAAAASALSVVLGQEVEISPPDTHVLDATESALDRFGTAPHATSASFAIGGEVCRLIQLIPSAFVVRMVRAMDELNNDEASDEDATPGFHSKDGHAGTSEGVGLADALTNIRVRVWAELGRTRLPLAEAIALPLGAVVDLDCAADAPVDLYVNGLRFAQGQLLITDEGDWAVSLEKLGGPGRPTSPAAEAQPQPQPQPQGALT
jgi:flagellar motor switch protein FliN